MPGERRRLDDRREADALRYAPETVRICLAAAIAVVLVVLLAADALGGESSAEEAEPGAETLTLTEYDLLFRADSFEPRAYWVGRQPGTDRFELERDADGNLFLRYLSSDGAGSSRADSLTVASYPVADAQAALEQAAQDEGGSVESIEGGVVLDAPDGYSTYVALEEQPELQFEVYSPQPGEAAELVRSGRLTPLHWTPLQ